MDRGIATAANLREAATGEQHECTSMYPDFAATARREGFPEIARVFDAIGVAERQHNVGAGLAQQDAVRVQNEAETFASRVVPEALKETAAKLRAALATAA